MQGRRGQVCGVRWKNSHVCQGWGLKLGVINFKCFNLWFFPFHFSPSRTWESFILLSHRRCLEKNVWVSLLDCIDLCHWISAFCSQVQILFCDGVCDAVLWTLSVGIKPVSIVYWKNDFYSWAQGYSLDVWNKVFDAFLCLMEVVLTLRYPIDLNLEIRIVWLCTLCLQSGGGACLWLP